MNDTTSAAPSDAEIDAQWRESVSKHEKTAAFVRDFARAVLAKWGAPQPVVLEPLTEEQIDDYIRHADASGRWGEAFSQGIRWAIRHYERAHGIGIKKGDSHA